MVQKIVADRKIDCSHLLGQFLDESHYDILVNEDTDCYMPPNECSLEDQIGCTKSCNACDKGTDEKRIAFIFRKNFFSKEEQDLAYRGLREAAVESQNRGIAAGPREGTLGNREWVTDYQYDILDYFLDPVPSLFGEDPIDAIRARYAGKPVANSNRARVWGIERVKKENFNFEEWVEATRTKTPTEQKIAATYVAEKLICATTYANSVFSGIAGSFSRYPRIPYARKTAFNEAHPDKFEMAIPFLQTLAKGFKQFLPWRYNNQMEFVKGIDPEYVVPGTPFTTITVNKTFRTAAHFDAGDLTTGLSNLLVLSNGGNYTGGYLVAPEYRVAVNVRPGDLLLINNHEVLHGNTPIVLGAHEEGEPEPERISIVCYAREDMGAGKIGSYEYESYRKAFVESNKADKSHRFQKPLWNGVFSGMWADSKDPKGDYAEAKDWYNFLKKHPKGESWIDAYHPWLREYFEPAVSLEDFMA